MSCSIGAMIYRLKLFTDHENRHVNFKFYIKIHKKYNYDEA